MDNLNDEKEINVRVGEMTKGRVYDKDKRQFVNGGEKCLFDFTDDEGHTLDITEFSKIGDNK